MENHIDIGAILGEEYMFGEAHITTVLKRNFGESFVEALNLLYKLDEGDKQRTIEFVNELLKADKYSHKSAKS